MLLSHISKPNIQIFLKSYQYYQESRIIFSRYAGAFLISICGIPCWCRYCVTPADTTASLFSSSCRFSSLICHLYHSPNSSNPLPSCLTHNHPHFGSPPSLIPPSKTPSLCLFLVVDQFVLLISCLCKHTVNSLINHPVIPPSFLTSALYFAFLFLPLKDFFALYHHFC